MSTGDPQQLAAAEYIAQRWLEKWQKLNPDADIIICGSIRRGEKMVRDIDIVVIDEEMHGTFARGASFEGVELNLCYVKEECRGSAMLFLTGSADFNLRMRRVAKSKGLKLNRYGLWNGDECIASKTEEDIFEALGLDYVPPEKRRNPSGEDRGLQIIASDHSRSYEVYIEEVHGYNFCSCKGFQYRQSCRHLFEALEKVS